MIRDLWAQRLVEDVGGNIGVCDGIVAQAYTEASAALCNPLDTTMPFAGATNYNTVGVKNYASLQDGLTATKLTLLNGHYADAVRAIFAGDAVAYVDAIARGPWGTWSALAPAMAALTYTRRNPWVGQVQVAGTENINPTEEEMGVSAVVGPNGQIIIYAVGAGSRDGHLLEFHRNPGDETVNDVRDITAGIQDPNPYVVQP